MPAGVVNSASRFMAHPPLLRLLIGGKLLKGGSTFTVLNPATGKELLQCPSATPEQLNDAIKSASKAFTTFGSKVSIKEREKMLFNAADKIAEHSDELAHWLTLEQGKPLRDARFEVRATVDQMKLKQDTSVIDSKILRDTNKERATLVYKPLGVVGAIAPWNFPLLIAATKVSIAVLTGNTVVFKPSPCTPVTSLMMGSIIHECFPPGVVNVIAGGNDIGERLVAHPDIAKISFTGSVPTGKAIRKACTDHMKRCTLELGGNDPAIVLADADVPRAAKGIFSTAFANTGQVCCAIKRVYVPRALHAEFCESISGFAQAATVGDGQEKATTHGPLQNKMQFNKVTELLQDTIANGATVHCGGLPTDLSGAGGYHFPLTVVSGVDDESRIVSEEQFGPVLPILAYDTEEEAIERANNTRFGLGSSVWGTDLDHCVDVGMQLNSGMMWVNKHLDLPATDPFGGHKESGLGREGGESGLKAYVEEQMVLVRKA
ncbi:hypothetical protein SARC_07705 [Sphaeroforma arctica JP610]|uniref:Aldehyde dehydrogenase domain-containing protein n=1 Tax=Sphaeroforma arctica JP610 TaxID=667725 RepID=A0A0L0FTA9_9EUKA|nr:hypothetical protein SARC_07705 [Sphaeroforma arctica JP610]KNC79914.1 hypothetical protein SARC_07705 [Sphaeroforma arctica JP610]|eukprot:XP_014153816.1 hypothetical protein SARC_07705 [Sphaeroforma arctica JP610]